MAIFDYRSKNYGAMAGLVLFRLLIGVEYGQMSIQLNLTQVGTTLTNKDLSTYQYPSRFNGYYWGPIIGFYDREQPINPIFKYVMPWIGIYSRVSFDYAADKGLDRGKGMGYAISIMPSKYLHFFVQYRTFTISTKSFNEYENPLNGNSLKTEEYLAGVLIPLWIR